VGLLADARAFLFPRQVSLFTAAAVATATPVIPSKPATQARGVTGGGNFSGRLFYEPNEALRDQAGYGQNGTYNVGQWQELAKANPYVAAGLDFICAPVADARVGVEPAKTGLDEGTAKKHAEFIEWAFTEGFRLGAHLESAARGFLLSGFSLFEPTFLQVPSPIGMAWGISALAERLPNSLDPAGPWLEGDDGRLTAVRQSGPVGMGGKWERPVLPAERVLLYSWKRQGNNFAGESQLRSVWYAASKVFTMLLKMTGVTLQREGAGLPVATPLTGTDAVEITPAQRDELMTLFANLSFHEAAGLVMPAGWQFDWKTSSSSNKGHLVDVMKSIGLWVLMQLSAQQIFLGTDSTGSRSVGEVHDARAMAFVRKVLAFMEGVLNGDLGEPQTGLVKRLIDFNFGPQPAYPRVKLTPQRPEVAASDQAQAAKTAKEAGLFTPLVGDENAWRERAGFQPITEEERDAAKEKAAALAPKLPAPGQSPGEAPEGEDDDAPKGKSLQASAPRAGWTPWRPLRASEQRTDWAALDKYFVAERDAGARLLQIEVVAMLAKAGPLIAGAMADGVVKPEEIAAIPLDTSRLSTKVEAFLAKQRAAGGASVRNELRGDGVLRAAEEEQEEREDEVVTETNEVIDAERNRTVRRIVSRTRAELERESVDALRTGGNAAEVLERTVSTQLESGAFRSDAGSVLTRAFNVGRDEAARILGGIAEVEYSALLDSSTCDACREMDGATAEFNSAEHDRMVPPNRDCDGRDNCRCVLVMIPGTPGEGDE